MARAYLYDVVLDTNGTPTSGSSVQVNVHGGGAATLYTTEAGGVTASNPLTSATDGSFSCWVAEGTYDLVISGSGLTTETVYRDLLKGSNEPGAVLTATGDIPYASAANTLARLAVGASGTVLHGGTTPSYSKVVDADVDAAAALAIAKLASYPSDGTKALFGDGTWKTPVATYNASFNVVSTLAETTLISQSIPGGTLTATGGMLVTIAADYFNNSGAGRTLNLKVKYGATTLFDDTSGAFVASATHRAFFMQFLLANEGATNTQRLAGIVALSPGAASGAGLGGLSAGVLAGGGPSPLGGSSAEDSTAAKTLAVTATHSASDPSLALKGDVTVVVV